MKRVYLDTIGLDPITRLITKAVETLVTDHDEFWLHAIVTDRSFEEGERNRHFRGEIQSFADCGFPVSLCAGLAKGINGNLAAIFGKQLPMTWRVETNPSRGRDVVLYQQGKKSVAIESKHIFD